ncbi:MAG TPA: carboxypeptidase-like regulatory domain-containing protein [Flavobacterium sp.]|nr:carboxypeptidase-like regulatory domain-containing protein [Flavobacterium sp.]
MKNLLFAFFTFCSLIAFSQEKVQFLDSETIEPIAFATVVFGDGLGGYTNENGEFTFDKKQSFSVSMLGYKTLYVSETEFKNTIKLQSEPILIDEVIILNKKRKQKIVKQKPYWSNSTWLDSYTPQIGNEIAVLIPNEKNQDMILSKITIPVATNPLRIFDAKSKNHFKERDEFPYTILRIQFYKNENNSPKELLYSDKIVVNVHHSEEKFKEIDLGNYGIDVPKNGLFVGIEFIGVTDENQKYVYVPNFYEVERGGKKIKVARQLNINIPIDEKSKKPNSFIRYSDWNNNGDKMKWQVFTEEIFLKLNKDRLKHKGAANIGLGYELKVYE